MKLNVHYSEYEREPQAGESYEHAGCPTYPVLVTDEHAASSYHLPVVVINGEAMGPGEIPPGELQLPKITSETLAERVRQAGYAVCGRRVDTDWLRDWDAAPEMGERHWHPAARWVQF